MADIRAYRDASDRAHVIALWEGVFGYAAEHNAPALVIDQKMRANDGLFFVCREGAALVGTILCGYDGHRGWLYSLAVQPAARHRGHGTALVRHAECALAALGCLKVNLQVVEGNAGVAGFYQRLGYAIEPRISMGRRLPPAGRPGDEPQKERTG